MYDFKRDILLNVLNVQIAIAKLLQKQCIRDFYTVTRWHLWPYETTVWVCRILHSYELRRI